LVAGKEKGGRGFALLIAVPAACAGTVSVERIAAGFFFLSALDQPTKGIRAGRPPPVIRRAAAIKISKDIYGFCVCGKTAAFSGANNIVL
jgi:hypothetical protein